MSNSSNDCAGEPFFGDVIFTYTRAQALADGVLIDAGALAQEAGFRLPVAITAAAWARLCGLDGGGQPPAGPSGPDRAAVGRAFHGVPCESVPGQDPVPGCCSGFAGCPATGARRRPVRSS